MLHYDYFAKVVDEIAHHPAMFFMVSLFRLVIGSLVVVFHNVWGDIVGTALTVLGRVILLAGIAGILFPHDILKMLPVWTKHPGWIRGILFFWLLIGIALLVIGFTA